MRLFSWSNLNASEIVALRTLIAFLNNRLEEQETLKWALQLNPNEKLKRLAVLDLLDGPYGRKMNEPWKSAWRLIEESWKNKNQKSHESVIAVNLQNRVRSGDRSGSLIADIAELVTPYIKVRPFSSIPSNPSKKYKKKPKTVGELLSLSLTSGKIVDPKAFQICDINDRNFLRSLAFALDAVVVSGVETAKQIGWKGERSFFPLGQLYRAYFVLKEDRENEHEPDEFHRGIAPSVKLLHSVVERLADIELKDAIQFAERWKLLDSIVHVRLWAALSRNSRITTSSAVDEFLTSTDDRQFWDLHSFPEISELRALRFSDLPQNKQDILSARIRKLPPRKHWPKNIDTEKVQSARIYWAVREFRRIELAGNALSEKDQNWIKSHIDKFRDLIDMNRIDYGYIDSPKLTQVQLNPDNPYDLIQGVERLKALENALSSSRSRWDSNSSEQAYHWIREQENQLLIISDFESVSHSGLSFPRVWENFGWAHSHTIDPKNINVKREIKAESIRVVILINKLPDTVIRKAIDGISHWLSSWREYVISFQEGFDVWFKIWPFAVEATNSEIPIEDEAIFDTVFQTHEDKDNYSLDTLNTPVAKLVDVFLYAFLKLIGSEQPFSSDGPVRRMRDIIIAATNKSKLISIHRMIEQLPYFLKADKVWSEDYLIEPLLLDNYESLQLWKAIARRTHFTEVLNILGTQMAERAIDLRLDRDTRNSFVFSLVVECLHSFNENRNPAVPFSRIQQMLRSLDDEVRANGARAVKKFVSDLSGSRSSNDNTPSPEELFQSSVEPFLTRVWPQEKSLSTPGVSQSFSSLPFIINKAFTEVVNIIERFLVPFDCWSLFDYGIRPDSSDKINLSVIDDQNKAEGFLKLLDLTIGTSEGSVVPHDLGDALDQIRTVAPTITDNQIFRRLATAARRF